MTERVSQRLLVYVTVAIDSREIKRGITTFQNERPIENETNAFLMQLNACVQGRENPLRWHLARRQALNTCQYVGYRELLNCQGQIRSINLTVVIDSKNQSKHYSIWEIKDKKIVKYRRVTNERRSFVFQFMRKIQNYNFCLQTS